MPADPDARIPDPSLRSAKQVLRGRILAMRDDMPSPAREAASRALTARIAALLSFVAARSVLLTLPFGSEWNTRALAEIALRAGKSVAVPRVDRVARMLLPHGVVDLDRDIVPGYLGIPEPRPERPQVAPSSLDWVLVPGVAFDASGRRLGYGGGFYDRLLPLLRGGVPRVAGAFEVQIVAEVPAGPHDAQVTLIATADRTLEVLASK